MTDKEIANKGDIVKLEYEGKLTSGEVFDSSDKHGQLLEFEIGAGKVIPGFDEAVQGMKVEEEKEINIPSDKAYGSRKEELKQEVPKSQLPPVPEGQELKSGMQLAVQTPQGQMPVVISEVKENSIVLDLNHPLAGKDLVFKVKVKEVKKGNEKKE